MIQRPFLLLPVLYLLLVFCLDKVFYLPVFREGFLQPGNSVFYYHRKLLFDKLIQERRAAEATPRWSLVLGDSRSYPFTELAFAESEKATWSLYNFSSPQSVPMVSYYWLRKVLQEQLRPSFVILSLSPEAWNEKRSFVVSPFLRYGSDPSFTREIWEDLTWNEKWNYTWDQIFRIRALEINLSVFAKRLKEKKLAEYKPSHNPDLKLLELTRGEFLLYATLANPTEKLEKDAQRIRQIYLREFSWGEAQYLYFQKCLDLLQKEKIPAVVVLPALYPTYKKALDSLGYDDFKKQVRKRTEEGGFLFYDVDKESDCRLFNDASHQSVFCFPSQMQTIWKEMGVPISFRKPPGLPN